MQRNVNTNNGRVTIPHELLDWEHIKNINAVYLYVYLLLSADTETGSVEVSIRGLANQTGISVQRVRTILKMLERDGLVTQQLTHQSTQQLTQRISVITICDYGVYEQVKSVEQHTNQHSLQHTNQHSEEEKVSPHTPLLKEEEEKNKRKILSKDNIKEKQKEADFIKPEFSKVFSLWLEYKRQKGQTYKSDISLKACYNKLVRLSGNDPETAMAIVEQSMANNWAGLFELKQQNELNNQDNGQQQYISDPVMRRNYERGRRLQALAERLAASGAANRQPAEPPF